MKNEVFSFNLELFFSKRGITKQQKNKVSLRDLHFHRRGGHLKYVNAYKMCPVRNNYF